MYTHSLLYSPKGFTIVELIITTIVFAVGFLGAFSLLQTSIDINSRSREEIITANLLREQIELIKNVRDSNWLQSNEWNSGSGGFSQRAADTLSGNSTYTIDLRDAFIDIKKLSSALSTPGDILTEVNSNALNTRLCLTSDRRYTHTCGGGATETPYHRFFRVYPVIVQSGSTSFELVDALRIESVIVSRQRPDKPYTLHTIITNWKK